MCCKQDKAFSFQYCASAVLVSGAALRRMETMTFEVATTRSFFVAWRIVSPPLPLVKVARLKTSLFGRPFDSCAFSTHLN